MLCVHFDACSFFRNSICKSIFRYTERERERNSQQDCICMFHSKTLEKVIVMTILEIRALRTHHMYTDREISKQ